MSITGTPITSADLEGLADAAAEFLISHITASRGIFRLVLTGGATPRPLYRKLASPSIASRVDWSRVELFIGDERYVPHEHKDSNFGMIRETLLANGYVAPRGIYPIPTDTPPEDCARRYETTLKEYYGASAINPHKLLFDCVLLGLGTDGHIASLLPGQPVLGERKQWVAAVPKGRETVRITLTYPALESARFILFLAAGADKAEAVARVRAGDTNLPGGRLNPLGETLWFLDEAAATASR